MTEELKKKIEEAIEKTDGWGSVEIFLQDNAVTQITTRSIEKIK